MDVKQELNGLVKIIDEKLEKYWQEEIGVGFGFSQSQAELVRTMLLHASEHNLRTAKRLRAAFVYYGHTLGKKEIDERIYRAMMAVELVHTALLMHDDVMDQDEIRRGKLTTHKYFEKEDKHYGESMAYNLGDGVLCLGFETLINSGFEPDLIVRAEKQFLRGIAETAWGQAFDVTLEKLSKWKDEDILAVHMAKTAVYTYKNPLLIGAILAKVDDKVLDILTDYSMKGGVAFQLQDDLLGVFGDPQKTGKSANSDLLQGKCTLLTMKTLEMGNKIEIEAIRKVWGKRVASDKEIEKAKAAIKSSGAFDYNIRIAKKYAEESREIADKLNGLGLNPKAVEFIEGIAEYMVNREV